MKKLLFTLLEPATATLLIVISIGLGIEVNPVFFLVALAVASLSLCELKMPTMKATVSHGQNDIRLAEVPQPRADVGKRNPNS